MQMMHSKTILVILVFRWKGTPPPSSLIFILALVIFVHAAQSSSVGSSWALHTPHPVCVTDSCRRCIPWSGPRDPLSETYLYSNSLELRPDPKSRPSASTGLRGLGQAAALFPVLLLKETGSVPAAQVIVPREPILRQEEGEEQGKRKVLN